jgi:hypothetical protein
MGSGKGGPCGVNPKTETPHMASGAASRPFKQAPKKEVPEVHVCAPCDHQDATDKIKARYGGTPPHLATTVDGGKDLSL